MKKLNTFWQSFQKSLLDFSYYKDVAKASFWFSFKYLFFLLACLSLVKSVQLGILYSSMKKNIPSYISIGQKELLNLYPKKLELNISNGKLYTNVQEPYIIEFPKILGDMGIKHMVVIDTKGTADNYPKYNTMVLATKQALVFPDSQQGNKTSTQLYYYSDLKKSVYMDYSEYSKMVQSLNPLIARLPRLINIAVIVWLFLLPFIGGFTWLASILFGLLFLTVGTWLIEKIVKTSYGYKTLFRMGMHGITWSILFTFLLEITHQQMSYLYDLIFFLWMVFVLLKNREPKVISSM